MTVIAHLAPTTPELTYDAHLDPAWPAGPDRYGSWSITFGFGKPAERTYTEVAFTRDARFGAAFDQLPERVLEEVVRRVAVDLYGTAWAFTYRPDQYAEAIARWGLRRRERVVVTSIEVWGP